MRFEKMKRMGVIVPLATQLFAQPRPAVELGGAIAKEQVDGDLKTAIAIYQKIDADTSAPRYIRARALLHMGSLLRKTRTASTERVTGRLWRDFGDQPEAVQAKARLAMLKEADRPAASPGMTQRKIDLPGLGCDTHDGYRFVCQVNRTWGLELISSDPAGKSQRVIFKAGLDDYPYFFQPSDSSMEDDQTRTRRCCAGTSAPESSR